jgi:Tol biopolymer transport system component
MSTSGGDPRKMQLPPLSFNSPQPLSLSQDGSELLMMDGHGGPPSGPLWSVPIVGGSPRKLGDIAGQDGAWSADGKFIAYGNGNSLFTAKADGTDARKVVTVGDSGFIFNPVWSPDGNHLRFTYRATRDASEYLMEISLEGIGLHRLLPGWTKPPDSECCGAWTVDGKYFVFMTRGQIWALPRKAGFLHSEPKPIQLTSSPMPLSPPLQSTDGKKLFVVGRTFRGELTRYDKKSGRFESYLGGISAEYVSFSKDGQWVAYVSFPEGTLWRSKMDGSERLQLTYAPSQVLMPRWSRDGKTILFFEASDTNKPSKIYEVSREGGSPQLLMPDNPDPQADPNWSPDGSKSSSLAVPRTLHPRSGSSIWQAVKFPRCPARKGCTRPVGLRTVDTSPDSRLTQRDFSYLISRPSSGRNLPKAAWPGWNGQGTASTFRQTISVERAPSSGFGSAIIKRNGLWTSRIFRPWAFTEVGLPLPPTIRRLCFATPGPRMFTPSTGKSRDVQARRGPRFRS